ncbi:hypothetical protein SAMN04488581_2640 [Mycolicibacterium neoaurum]|uniref:hypothetical protein n=1 Tax=Mycolicibacterium neoaurum TaxID=1795 RepID=UPI000567D691|nr:hypothetical protein [Mycolicibacterium neoaurum]SDD60302.1 hypothetical protein SAMN04488581_2640 [Mycolicibacterium neoaurum]
MTALKELVDLAREKGYQDWDTTSGRGIDKRRSWTFGKEGVFCLHVRFDKQWRVINAIYIKTEGKTANTNRDQYIHPIEKHKRDKVYWILNCLPDSFDGWDKLFPHKGLKWTRVMDGEYQGQAANGDTYFVDFVSTGCPECDHRHEGWQLSGSTGVAIDESWHDSMSAAKAAANAHAEGGDAA